MSDSSNFAEENGISSYGDLQEGMMVKGVVKNIVRFGAFIDIGIEENALLHISEMSDSFVHDPSDIVNVGDTIEAKIIRLEKDRKKISLSLKS